MADLMTFPNTVEEFMEQYKITDTEQIYTNGAELVPIFRMKQWFEHLPTANVPDKKVGKWVHGREIAREMIGDCITAIFYDGWKCSECGCEVEKEREPLWKFCPNCGVQMKGGKAE